MKLDPEFEFFPSFLIYKVEIMIAALQESCKGKIEIASLTWLKRGSSQWWVSVILFIISFVIIIKRQTTYYGSKGKIDHIYLGDLRKTLLCRWPLWRALQDAWYVFKARWRSCMCLQSWHMDPDPTSVTTLRDMGRDETWYMLKYRALIYDCTSSIYSINSCFYLWFETGNT